MKKNEEDDEEEKSRKLLDLIEIGPDHFSNVLTKKSGYTINLENDITFLNHKGLRNFKLF